MAERTDSKRLLHGLTDVFTKSKRSQIMSLIRGAGNKSTELRLIQILRANRVTGWRRGSKLLGKPDFVFQKPRLAVFVDGCFWHDCPLHGTKPVANGSFWRKKIARNRERDREVNRVLRTNGWRVLRIWGHELARKKEAKLVSRIHALLKLS